ncbi:hypothetical protein OF83DRAFT_1050246 [Amylostereum chailletii]|nr:hypothetical protein OF83DRAFT_1050246 [Amylostereum chailletii]
MANFDTESYLLLLLSDANLPTGSFVASSGLESCVAHSLFHASTSFPISKSKHAMDASIAFVRDSVATYASSAIPFARDAQRVVLNYASSPEKAQDSALNALIALDATYEATALNHVARRASCSQGVALLTLYTKGFTRPPSLTSLADGQVVTGISREKAVGTLIERLKLHVRREDTPGHLPVCWGVLAGALDLSIERGAHLHLFLHARGLLSAAIRMNALGPYAAQQVLLHAVRPIVDTEAARCAHLTTGVLPNHDHLSEGMSEGKQDIPDAFKENKNMPATTWPLGEILSSRHDLLHSRIFNS